MNRKDRSRFGRTWLTAAILATAVGWHGSAAATRASAAAPTTSTAPAATEPTLSAQAYTDKMGGFSLRPPLDSERIKDPSSATLVRWIGRDAKTGAVSWTIGVNVALEKDPNLDLRIHAEALAAHLLDANALHEVLSTDVTRVDGKIAADIRGTTGRGDPAAASWRRQVWVVAQPGRFLIFWVVGPASARDRLDQALTAVLATVKIIDPLEALKAQEVNLLRGRQFLAELSKKALAAAPSHQWFAFRQDDKVVGWTLQAESQVQRGKQTGLEVQTLTMLRLPKDDQRLSRRTLFATSAGGEQWKETLQVGEGEKSSIVQEEGLRQEGLLVCTLTLQRKVTRREKKVPFDANEPREMYLPRCLGTILPRLIDLSKPGGYAFATYSTPDNEFHLRTFTVLGREKITLGGRQIEAVHLTDVEEANEESASDLWVDAAGMPLRIRAPGWPVIDASSREEIIAKMPEAAKIIEEALKK